jgi:hypothetical protein
MKLLAVLLALALIAPIVRADDYYLSEEEDEQANEEASQGDFIKHFTCLVATQRYINHREEAFKTIQAEPMFPTNLKRLKARLYGECLREVPQETVSAVQAATSAKDFDQIDFSVVEQVPYKDIFDETDSKLNDEDRNSYRNFLKVEEQVREMQKKHKRDNPDQTDESEEDETWETIRKSKEPPSLAGVGLSSTPLVAAVGIALSVLGLVVFKLAKTIFDEPKKSKKKDKKKLN